MHALRIKKYISSIKSGTVLGNVSWSVLHRGICFLNGVIVMAVIARHLGPSGYGILMAALSMVAILSPLCKLGYPNLLIRDFNAEEYNCDLLFSSAYLVQLFVSICLWLGFLGYLFLVRQVDSVYLIISLMVLLQPLTVAVTFEQARLNIRSYVILDIYVIVALAVIRFWGAYCGASVAFFAIWHVIYVSLPAGILFYGHMKKRLYKISLSGWREVFELHRKDIFYLTLSSLTAAIFMNQDVLMLFWLSEPSEAGKYSVGARLSAAFSFLPLVISSAYLAKLSKYDARDIAYRLQLNRYFRINTAVSFLVVVVALIIFPFVILHLYGTDFADSVLVFSVHVPSLLFLAWGVARQQCLIHQSKTEYSFTLGLLGVVLNFVLNLYAIIGYGAVGAAWATLITQCMMALVFPLLFAETRAICIVQLLALIPFRSNRLA